MALKKVLIRPKAKLKWKATPRKIALGIPKLAFIPRWEYFNDIKSDNAISDYTEIATCREEIIREINDNLDNLLVTNAKLICFLVKQGGYSTNYSTWNDYVIPLSKVETFARLLDIFVGAIASGISTIAMLEACGPREACDYEVYNDRIFIYNGIPSPMLVQNPHYVSLFYGAAKLCSELVTRPIGKVLTENEAIRRLVRAAIQNSQAGNRKKAGIAVIKLLSDLIPKHIVGNVNFPPTKEVHFKALQLLTNQTLYQVVGDASSISRSWMLNNTSIEDSNTGFDDLSHTITLNHSKKATSKPKNHFPLY